MVCLQVVDGEQIVSRLIFYITFVSDKFGLKNGSELQTLLNIPSFCGFSRLPWLWKPPVLFSSVGMKEKLLYKNILSFY